MEKLLELLNEYGKGSFELEIDNDTGELTGGIVDAHQDTFEVTSYYITMQIISKRFGFIERLVKNDKINKYKLEQEAMSWFNDESPVYGKDIRTDRLIMMLSVSNSPIKDLIYYLGKEDDEHYIKPGGYKLVFNAKK